MIRNTMACKIVLLGEGAVGKTSLRRKYLGESFNVTYQMTIGADFAAKRTKIDDYQITANIWDLAGQLRFKAMRETYYKGASGALIVYDIARPSTMDKIPEWIDEMKTNNGGISVPMVIIGNKSDLRGEVQDPVSYDKGQEFVDSLKSKSEHTLKFIESSAKTGENVENAFQALIEEIYADFKAHTQTI